MPKCINKKYFTHEFFNPKYCNSQCEEDKNIQ